MMDEEDNEEIDQHIFETNNPNRSFSYRQTSQIWHVLETCEEKTRRPSFSEVFSSCVWQTVLPGAVDQGGKADKQRTSYSPLKKTGAFLSMYSDNIPNTSIFLR